MENISKYRTELMGLSILWIMFFHSQIYVAETLLPLKFIKGIGYAGVDIFFLLSGIGLTFSMSKDNSLLNFYRKRILRIVPTYWTCLLLILALKYILTNDLNFHAFWLSLIGVDYLIFGSLKTWFIPAIILCYLAFPILYSLSVKYGYKLVLLAFGVTSILGSLIIAQSPMQYLLIFTIRIPVFILGIYIGFLLINKEKSILNNLYFNGVILVIATAILGAILLKTESSFRWDTGLWWYPTIVMALPITIFSACLFDKIKPAFRLFTKLFKSFGLYSLEIYLIHSFIFDSAKHFPLSQYDFNFLRIPEYILYIIISFFISYVINHAMSKVNWGVISQNLFQRNA